MSQNKTSDVHTLFLQSTLKKNVENDLTPTPRLCTSCSFNISKSITKNTNYNLNVI